MACDTCDHTMEAIVPGVFWCPRCGTIKSGFNDVAEPSLVARCRNFEILLSPYHEIIWRRFGIQEAIRFPKDRKE